jgi:quercetin dioxygenase-like cupin family protein
MSEQLAIGPTTTLRVLGHTDDALELEATYAGGGSAPPPHFHPQQDERFEVVEGTMQVRLDGADRELNAGDVLEIPRGVVHQMWNEGDETAILNWRTEPAGRTLDWFREVAAVMRGEGRPNPEDLLSDYADVYRLAEQ